MTTGKLEKLFHMSGGYHQQDIIVFITDFDFQLSTDVYGPSCQLFSPSDPKVQTPLLETYSSLFSKNYFKLLQPNSILENIQIYSIFLE